MLYINIQESKLTQLDFYVNTFFHFICQFTVFKAFFLYLVERRLSCYNKEADRFGDNQTAHGLERWQLLHQHGAAGQGRATYVQKRVHVQRGKFLVPFNFGFDILLISYSIFVVVTKELY